MTQSLIMLVPHFSDTGYSNRGQFEPMAALSSVRYCIIVRV